MTKVEQVITEKLLSIPASDFGGTSGNFYDSDKTVVVNYSIKRNREEVTIEIKYIDLDFEPIEK